MAIWLVIGGLATALAFPLQPDPTRPGFALWPLAWMSLTPLFVGLWRAESIAAAARTAFLFAVPWFFVDCVWVFRVFDVYGWVLIGLPVGWIVVFGVLAVHARRAGFSPWLAWPLIWIAVEFVRSEWSPIRLDLLSPALDPLRFSWLVLGHSRVSEPVVAQTAALLGGYWLSLAPLLSNLLVANCIVSKRVPNWPVLAAVIILVAVEISYGVWTTGRSLTTSATPPSVLVGVVQSEREHLPTLFELTESLLEQAPETRIVVWPEESFAEKLGDLAVIQAFASQRNVAIAAGAEFTNQDGGHENRAYFIPPTGEIGIYHKRERVPFVEQHQPDTQLPTFPLIVNDRVIRTGILICYDADFPTTARELSRAGAEILLIPTLDEGGWGGTQHVEHALLPRLRAIENRRPVVQAATSGVSQIIDDHGRVLAEVPYRLNRRPQRPTLFREGTAHASITPNATTSFYTAGGYWFGPLVAAAAAGVIVTSVFRRRRPR